MGWTDFLILFKENIKMGEGEGEGGITRGAGERKEKK